MYRVISDPDFYLRGPGFQSHPGDLLSWQTYFVLLLRPCTPECKDSVHCTTAPLCLFRFIIQLSYHSTLLYPVRLRTSLNNKEILS